MNKLTTGRIVLALVLMLLVASIVVPINSTALAAGTCFKGSSKGVIWDGKAWHHYVQFNVDVNGAGWKVSGPLWPSVWGYSASKVVRAGYSWPSNWWDPYSPSSWTVCR